MPLIPSNYINSWYKVQDKNEPKDFYYLKTIQSSLSQTVERKNLIQGEVGTHVMSIRDATWSCFVDGAILILPTKTDEEYKTKDIFSLFLTKFDKLKKFFKEVDEDTVKNPELDFYLKTNDLLSKAQFNLNQDNLDMRLTFLNHHDQIFDLLLPKEKFVTVPKDTKFTQNINAPFYSIGNKSGSGSGTGATGSGTGVSTNSFRSSSLSGTGSTSETSEPGSGTTAPQTTDYNARFAKFYDVKFYIPEDNVEFIIKRGNINVEIEYFKHFYLNSNTTQPFYEPKGYSINGEVEIIIPVDIWTTILQPEYNNGDRLLPGQNFMQLIRDKVNCSISLSDGRIFKVGLVNATSDFSLNMSTAGDLPSATIRFETYASNF